MSSYTNCKLTITNNTDYALNLCVLSIQTIGNHKLVVYCYQEHQWTKENANGRQQVSVKATICGKLETVYMVIEHSNSELQKKEKKYNTGLVLVISH